MLDKMKQLGGVRKMMAIKKQLAKEKLVVEEEGVRVVITGEMKIKEIEVDGQGRKEIVEVVNKAIKKSQELMASRMQEVTKSLGF